MQDNTLYGYTLAEHEYRVTVPKAYRNMLSEPDIIIAISAHGGGTVGESYADNGWDYAVYVDGAEVISGQDLRSNGTPGSHAQMARALCSFLYAEGESINFGNSDGSGARGAFLVSEYERLGTFSDEGVGND